MQEPENGRTNEHEIAALFAAAGNPPQEDARFVAGVMKRVRRREQFRWLALGGSTVLAAVLAVPVFGTLEAAWSGAELNVIASLRPIADQLAATASTFVQSMGQYTTFLTVAALAAIAVRLLGLLED